MSFWQSQTRKRLCTLSFIVLHLTVHGKCVHDVPAVYHCHMCVVLFRHFVAFQTECHALIACVALLHLATDQTIRLIVKSRLLQEGIRHYMLPCNQRSTNTQFQARHVCTYIQRSNDSIHAAKCFLIFSSLEMLVYHNRGLESLDTWFGEISAQEPFVPPKVNRGKVAIHRSGLTGI